MEKKEVPKLVSNFELHTDKVVIFVSQKLFSLHDVKKTAVSFNDRAWVAIDSNEDEILVELKPKKNQGFEQLALEFNSTLLEVSTENLEIGTDSPALTNKIRKVVKQFILEEQGQVSKQSIIAIGALLAGMGLVGVNTEVTEASHYCGSSSDGGDGGEGGDGGDGDGGEGDGCEGC